MENGEFFRKAIEDYCKEKEFQLNPDESRVSLLVKGVVENEKNYGLKYCPCRIRTKDFQRDLQLVCPCNFFAQKTWQEKGECWCSLFVKRSNYAKK
ncbi:MAG: ferredoxin-thioredoxin reductase catalytic domain-containing protein [Candidatus Micrarchaeia archaeon]|jgi:ferredoxin-thioredoxin reductase catalytic subunit